jgi:hypothetical protein
VNLDSPSVFFPLEEMYCSLVLNAIFVIKRRRRRRRGDLCAFTKLLFGKDFRGFYYLLLIIVEND